MNQDIRWQQRFSSFSKALNLLRIIKDMDINSLSDLEKEGIIQRFEFTFELAWKMLNDRMNYDGLNITMVSPKSVFRHAYTYNYISNVDLWLKMTEDRNLMSHTYESEIFKNIIITIKTEYLEVLEELHGSFIEEKL
jgi:nucleotidyltransferase substrate binding protein (TIGR01987 family)